MNAITRAERAQFEAATVTFTLNGREVTGPSTDTILEIADRRKIPVLEDACQAVGAAHQGRAAGSIGRLAAFSFYPTKVMTGAEGGMIVTNNQSVYEEALIYRDQGKADFLTNAHTRLGYNWRMSEPHAIIGHSQLNRLEEFIAARNRIARVYDHGLKGMPGVTALSLPQGCRSNYYKYIALLDIGIDRSALKKLMRAEFGVGLSGEVYEAPCHLQPVFAEYRDGEFPTAEDVCRRHICLPVYATMTDEDARYVLASLEAALGTMKGEGIQ